MSLMFNILLVIQIIASLTIISLVLLQQGKGADMGSSFGGGSAGSLFGATGAANFLSRATKWAAVVFFITTIGLAYVSNRGTRGQDTGVMQNFTQTPPSSTPATPATPAVPSLPGASSVPSAAPSVAPATVPIVPAPTMPTAPVSK